MKPKILVNPADHDGMGRLLNQANNFGAYLNYVCRFFTPNPARQLIIAAVDVRVCKDELQRLVSNYGPLDVLAWEYDSGLTALNLDARLYVIPAMLMDRQAVAQGDVRYNELCTVQASMKQGKSGHREITLTDFIMPPLNRRGIEVAHFSQWVDYWSVDFDWDGQAHTVGAYAYRAKKEEVLTLKLASFGVRAEAITRIQVVDLFANETFLALV